LLSLLILQHPILLLLPPLVVAIVSFGTQSAGQPDSQTMKRQWQTLCVLVLLVPLSDSRKAPFAASAASASVSGSGPPQLPLSTSAASTSDAASAVVQIFEEEVYSHESGAWRGNLPSRWLDHQGRPSPAPPNVTSPTEWSGDWKIVTSQHRDSLGWEYLWSPYQPAMRRRVWLRTQRPPLPDDHEHDKHKQQQHQQQYHHPYRSGYNFKGYGLNLYRKQDSLGFAWKIPLTSNFDWWERRAALPSLSWSFALFYPWCLIGYLSCSMSVEYLIWTMRSIVRIAKVAVLTLILSIFKLAAIPFLPLLFPFTKSMSLPSFGIHIPPLNIPEPQGSSQVQEKVGWSVSWRYSLSKGYEYRISQSYSYLPTLVYLAQLQRSLINMPLISSRLLDWFRRKTGSLGLNFGIPSSSPTGFSYGVMMSLSGLYFSQSLPKQPTRIVKVDEDEEPVALVLESSTVQGRVLDVRKGVPR
jgi:hypothetical protein